MTPNIIKKLFNNIFPSFIKRKIEGLLFRSNMIKTPILSKESKNRLKSLFSKDVRRLEELINIELNVWHKK